MTHSPLTNGIRLTSDHSSRDGRRPRKFIAHHAATNSLNGILSLFQPGGRTVSANYAMGNDGTLVLAVDEDRRAWTSSSVQDDGEAITIEIANARTGDPWPISAASFDKLARLIADVSIRYGFPINDDTVLTHQELWTRFRRSYPTACPGDIQRRKGELLGLANRYRSEALNPVSTIITKDDTNMTHTIVVDGKHVFAVGPESVKHLSGPEAEIGPKIASTLDEVHKLSASQFRAVCGFFGIPAAAVDPKTAAVLDPYTGKKVPGGHWSRERENGAKLDQLLKR